MTNEVNHFKILQQLNLGNNQLKGIIPSIIFEISTLKKINLSQNKISNISDQFSRLNNLIEINFSKNEIQNFPDIILSLTSITKLNLSNNNLSILPNEINKLSNLIDINLENNLFHRIPPLLYQISSLNSLKLSNNPIDHSIEKKLINSYDGNIQNIFGYLKDLQLGTIRWPEVKVLFVGQEVYF